MDTKTCKECGRELPIIHFRRIRDGVICGICKDCTNAKMRATKASKSLKMGEGGVNYTDSEFDGKKPREVIDYMTRAKRWLESQGYNITLRGEYREVKIRKIKFQ